MIASRTSRGILVLGLLTAVSFWANRDGDRRATAPISGLDTRLDYALYDFEAHYYDTGGRLAASIEAPNLANDAATGVGTIRSPDMRVLHPDSEWNIEAQSATISPGRDEIVLRGEVDMVRIDPATGARVDVHTAEVVFEVVPRIARSRSAVEVIDGDDRLRAVGFHLDLATNRFSLLNDVRGIYAIP